MSLVFLLSLSLVESATFVRNMSDEMDRELESRADEVFQRVVKPVFEELIEEYRALNGYEARIVQECPLIMGIKRHRSIFFKHPDGTEMIVCVYWIGGHERLFAANIMMVSFSKTFDIYAVNGEELKKQIKFLAGLGR